MWDQPTEPTLVGAPVGHPDGSFGMSSAPPPGGAQSTNPGASSLWGQPPPGNVRQSAPSGWGAPPNGKPPGPQWGAPGGQQPPTPMKNGPSANGWEPASAPIGVPTGGWTTPAPGHHQAQQAAMWNGGGGVQNSQWEANSSGGGASSWSQIASKNVPPASRGKPTVFDHHHPGAVNAGSVQQQQPASAGGGPPPSVGWSSQPVVDQGPSWATSQPDAGNKHKEWQANAPNIAPSGWGDMKGPNPGPNAAPSWQNAAHKDKSDPTGTSYWKEAAAAPPAPVPNAPSVNRSASSSGGGPNQWGGQQQQDHHHHVTSGSGWDSLPPQSSRGTSSYNHSEPVTPSNVWTGPPTDGGIDNSMVWNNPNPKKVVQPDKGTGVWGDPQVQNEIRRWKSTSEEQQRPSTKPQSSVDLRTSSYWKETPLAAPTSWPNASDSNGKQDDSLSGASAWGDTSAAPKSAPGLSGWTPPSANELGLAAPAKPIELQHRSSAENDSNDDVFSSNATTPMSHKNGMNQRLPNQPPIAQSGKILQNLQNIANNQQIEMLTSKISDQLKAACAAGLIDKSVLYNRLPQETLVRLYYLLQCLPKLEQAQRELHALRQGAQQNALNDAQNQEIRRLTNEVHQYQTAIQTMKVQINAQIAQLDKNAPSAAIQLPSNLLPPAPAPGCNATNNAASASANALLRPNSSLNLAGSAGNKEPQPVPANGNQPAPALPVSPVGGDLLNQSKLMQWKNANGLSSSSAGSAEEEKNRSPGSGHANNLNVTSSNNIASTLVSSPSASNLENLVQSMASATFSLGGATGDHPWGANNGQEHAAKRESTPSSIGCGWPNATRIGEKHSDDNSSEKTETQSRESPADKNLQNIENIGRSASNASDFRPTGGKIGPNGTADEGPPEFKPGQKWMWKDPKEMAEDPNATPGSVKPNTLTLNTNLNAPTPTPFGMLGFGGGSGSGSNFHSSFAAAQHFGAASGGGSGGGAFQPQFGGGGGGFGASSGMHGGWMGHQQGQPPPHPAHQPHHHGQRQPMMDSLFGGGSGGMPGKLGGDDFKMKPQGADFFAASRLGSASAVGGFSRMPPNLGGQMGGGGSGSAPGGGGSQTPFGGRPPLMKQQQFSVPNAFMPYGGAAGGQQGQGQQQQQHYIVLTITNSSQIDEHTLQLLVNNHGTTQTYISPPGSGAAFVKFRDIPLDRILPKLQQEFMPLGVTIQMMKDAEVERLLQAFNARQVAAASAVAGPPRHGVWDAPPPPMMGPWGAPGAGVPPPVGPPHPFGAPPPNMPPMGVDHVAAAAAQLLHQQSGGGGPGGPLMHESLLGHERHPF